MGFVTLVDAVDMPELTVEDDVPASAESGAFPKAVSDASRENDNPRVSGIRPPPQTLEGEALARGSEGVNRPIPLYGPYDATTDGGKPIDASARGKRPRMGGWQKDATTDLDAIKGMPWRRGGNIGIATGNGLVVLDFDRKNAGNIDSVIAAFEVEHGSLPSPTETTWVRTHGGGTHVYLRVDDSREFVGRTGVWKGPGGSALDIRSDGNQVVAPPSIHRNGGQYEL